jgi:GST-like protein
MITLYTWFSPNGYKASILLEELGIPYRVRLVDLGAGQQRTPEFLAISPNNKIPAIVDHDADDLSVFESGAILTYLAEKYRQFLPTQGAGRYTTLEWVNWHMGNLGPVSAFLFYFSRKWAGESPLGTQRLVDEAHRLFDVLDKRLANHAYLAGDEYSIADIANYPWTAFAERASTDLLGDLVSGRPSLNRWLRAIEQRPAVLRGTSVPLLRLSDNSWDRRSSDNQEDLAS